MDANELAKLAVEGAPFKACAEGGGYAVYRNAGAPIADDGESGAECGPLLASALNALAAQTLRAERAEKALGERPTRCEIKAWCEARGMVVCATPVDPGWSWVVWQGSAVIFQVHPDSGKGKWRKEDANGVLEWPMRRDFAWPDRDAAWAAFCAARDAAKVGG